MLEVTVDKYVLSTTMKYEEFSESILYYEISEGTGTFDLTH